jgi:hypothetical protein
LELSPNPILLVSLQEEDIKVHTKEEGTERKMAIYKPRRKHLKTNQFCQHLDLGLLASQIVRK